MKTFILGADDPEMRLIESRILEHGGQFVHAVFEGRRVTPATAYKADPEVVQNAELAFWVECAPAGKQASFDHHRLGDPGYSCGPEKFVEGSSLGQVVFALTGKYELRPDELVAAACDHCLGHVYAGRCPGVTPEQVLEHRVGVRSAWRQATCKCCGGSGRQRLEPMFLDPENNSGYPEDRECEACGPAATAADIAHAGKLLAQAPSLSHDVKDMRGAPVPELPDAGCCAGVAYIATPVPGKVVLGGATPQQVQAFLAGEILTGLTGLYGVPERGYAGGVAA